MTSFHLKTDLILQSFYSEDEESRLDLEELRPDGFSLSDSASQSTGKSIRLPPNQKLQPRLALNI